MNVKITEKQSDHELPCLDILHTNEKEAFELGELFNKLKVLKMTVWKIKFGIRIPMFMANKIGLIDYTKINQHKVE